MKYKLDPTLYSFLPYEEVPNEIKGNIYRNSYVKIITGTASSSFWYQLLVQPYGDDRWLGESGLYDAKHKRITSSVNYCGCITSIEFAETLLAHLLGTTKDSGVNDFGVERLYQPSLSGFK